MYFTFYFLLDPILFPSFKCLIFKPDSLDGNNYMFKSVLEHMKNNSVSNEMVNWVNIEWGVNGVANKRVSVF
jgi:hypothetical protein